MHSIFGILDIVVKISSLVEDNQDLYSLSRVSQLVSRGALDVLWSDITLDKYLYLFRQELAPFGGDTQMKNFPGVSLSISHLERIKTYALRVRTLRRSPVLNLAELIAVSAIHRQDPVIFPFLRNLIWQNGHIDELPLLIIFFAPTLKVLNLRDTQPVPSDNTLENSYESSMLTPLNVLLTRKIHLRKLYLPIPIRTLEVQSETTATHIPDIMDDYRAACEAFFDHGMGDYLVEADVILTPGILRRVGRLTQLRYLRLYQITCAEELEDMLEEDSARASSDNDENVARFPALECLSLRQLKSLSRITMMLFQFSCIPLYEFHTEVDLMPSEDDLSWLVHILTNSRRTLKTFGLRVGSDSLSRFLPNAESNIRFRTTFRPLFRCPEIRYLFLQIPFQIEFTDNDVRNIVQSWPYLQILYLGENPADKLSIKGFTNLASCPTLQYVHLSFAIRKSELAQFFGKTDISQGPAASCLSLERMHINKSTIEVGCAVGTAFLFQVCFPRAELVLPEENSELIDGRSAMVDRWEEVREGMKAVRDIVMAQVRTPVS